MTDVDDVHVTLNTVRHVVRAECPLPVDATARETAEVLRALAAELRDLADTFSPLPTGPYARMAGPDGYVRGITRIVNMVTGALVTLPEPVDVHVDDMGAFVEAHQERFRAEWEAGAGERERRTMGFWGRP